MGEKHSESGKMADQLSLEGKGSGDIATFSMDGQNIGIRLIETFYEDDAPTGKLEASAVLSFEQARQLREWLDRLSG